MIGRLFGQCVFRAEHGEVQADSGLHFGLLLFVAAHGKQGCSRDDVTNTLWAGTPAAQARHNLRQAMYRLRKMGFPISLRSGNVSLSAAESVDLHEILYGSPGNARLLELGSQPFLPGYATNVGGAFADWLDRLRLRVSGILRRAFADALKRARAEARFREIRQLAPALLRLDPLSETATFALAEALAMDGSKVEAIRMLEAYEDEVGVKNIDLQIPARTLRRRVSESLGDRLLLQRFEVPFVGREEEYDALRQLYDASRRNASQLAVLTGEAGIGKTRLASEIVRLAALDGATVVTYACSAGDALSPLSSLLHLVQSLLSSPGALGCASEHLQFLRRIVSGESAPGQGLEGIGADLAYAQLVYAISELAAAVVDEAPVAVFIDDAQRLHQTAWRIVADLVGRLHARSFFVVVATRTLPSWHSASAPATTKDSQVIRLKALPAESRLAFVRAWSEKNRVVVDDGDAERIAVTSAGNPFYLSELAAHLGREGSVALLPPSIRGLIELQYSALSKEAQRLLTVVSLLQSRAAVERVTRILEVQTGPLVDALDELEQAGLVSGVGTALKVKHELVADVTIALALPGVLGVLRQRAASCLEKEGESTGNLELLADALTLWEEVGDSDAVYSVGMRLGSRFLDVGLTMASVATYKRAYAAASTPEHKARATIGEIRARYIQKDFRGLRSLLDSADPCLTEFYPEWEVVRAEAAYWANGLTLDPTVRLLVANRSLLPAIRIHAAELAAIAADHNNDLDGIKRAFDDVSDLRDDDPKLCSFLDLVSLAACGTKMQADAAIRSFRFESPGEPLATRIGRQLRSVEALVRTGSRQDAEVVLREALGSARAMDLRHFELTLRQRLAAVQLLNCEFEQANEQVRLLVEASSENSHPGRFSTGGLLATFAWLRRDKAQAQRAQELLSEWAFGSPHCIKMGVRLHAIAIEHNLSGICSDSLLDEAVSLVESSQLLGYAELEFGVFSQILVDCGRREQAAQICAGVCERARARGITPSLFLMHSMAAVHQLTPATLRDRVFRDVSLS